MERERYDIAILGEGFLSLATEIALLQDKPNLENVIAYKENEIAKHASGRNSGILHAGFYYTPDSLKSRFCLEGNRVIKQPAIKSYIPVREVGKVVVARNSDENKCLDALFEQGIKNGVGLDLLEESRLSEFEPLAVTHQRFLWPPSTAISDSKAIVKATQEEFLGFGGKIDFERNLKIKYKIKEVFDYFGNFDAQHNINAAGMKADRIWRLIGVGNDYAMLAFIGLYRATEKKRLPRKRLFYPVPHPISPFLGVHFTLTLDNKVKIGPTAIPILGREKYSFLEGWPGPNMVQATIGMVSHVRGKANSFSAMLKSELPQLIESTLVRQATRLISSPISVPTREKTPPSVRERLVHHLSGKLDPDFVLYTRHNFVHILSMLCLGWTRASHFGRHVTCLILS